MHFIQTFSRIYRFSLALLALLLGSVVYAGSPSGAVSVNEAWVRAVPVAGMNGAAYMTLVNQGEKTLTLTAVDMGDLARVELHESVEHDGMMHMNELAGGIELPPGQPVVLKPGGLHIMLMGVSKALLPDHTVQATLRFSDGTSQTLEIPVKPLVPGS